MYKKTTYCSKFEHSIFYGSVQFTGMCIQITYLIETYLTRFSKNTLCKQE